MVVVEEEADGEVEEPDLDWLPAFLAPLGGMMKSLLSSTLALPCWLSSPCLIVWCR